jgi:hypothetical protein
MVLESNSDGVESASGLLGPECRTDLSRGYDVRVAVMVLECNGDGVKSAAGLLGPEVRADLRWEWLRERGPPALAKAP